MGERILTSEPDTMKERKYWSVIILAVIVKTVRQSAKPIHMAI